MKKFFVFAITTVLTCAMAACGGKGGQSPEEENAANELAASGNTFEGTNFTITYPGTWRETWTNETSINAAPEGDNITKLDATFNDYPCKPGDFEQYYQNYTNMSMNASFNFEPAAIDGNILTFKGVNGDLAMTNFVVYLDDNAGVAGSFKYPVAKAAEIEPLIRPILNTIKKK